MNREQVLKHATELGNGGDYAVEETVRDIVTLIDAIGEGSLHGIRMQRAARMLIIQAEEIRRYRNIAGIRAGALAQVAAGTDVEGGIL